MITDTEVQEFIRTISMSDREWGQYKVKRDHARRGICIVYDPIPDSEPTELTFRRTDEPTKEANWLAFRVAIGMTVMVTCIAFLIVGGR